MHPLFIFKIILAWKKPYYKKNSFLQGMWFRKSGAMSKIIFLKYIFSAEYFIIKVKLTFPHRFSCWHWAQLNTDFAPSRSIFQGESSTPEANGVAMTGRIYFPNTIGNLCIWSSSVHCTICRRIQCIQKRFFKELGIHLAVFWKPRWKPLTLVAKVSSRKQKGFDRNSWKVPEINHLLTFTESINFGFFYAGEPGPCVPLGSHVWALHEDRLN